ncbi:MAG TPA: CRISPR-associated endonuclease Cas1 [Minicystis sp.]|nr:CRISPR-associated endonuclease Cas1 [Minicystis sp.]
MINEVVYCERLFYLEWVQGEWDENAFTVDGTAVHHRVDKPGRTARPRRTRAAPAPQSVAEEGPPPLPYRARSVWLTSERLGVTAKIDVVEGEGGSSDRVTPIEYKRGSRPDVAEGAYLPERVQVCVHGLLLREHGFTCDEGAIFYAATRQRVAIAIDDALVATTLEAIARARALGRAGRLPPPLVDSPKCNGCSLSGICLPDEVNLLRRLGSQESVTAPDASQAEPAPTATSRAEAARDDEDDAPPAAQLRILATRDERVPLYVTDQGASIRLDAECLIVRPREGQPTEVRLPNTSHVAVFGNVQLSAQAIRALIERDIPLLVFSSGGYYLGRTIGHEPKNVELRIAQHAAAQDETFRLRFARGIIASKIENARTLVRRNHPEPPGVALSELTQLARKARSVADIGALLGLEGTAARTYFGAFAEMLRGRDGGAGFDFEGRNRRPPRDPVNALLSLAYALLTKDCAVAVAAVGLDPALGFLHRPRYGRPSLALDVMEEFRPLIADSVVLNAVNTGVVDERDFVRHGDACAVSPAARRRFVLAYERRLMQTVAHPVFGYRISYRRVLELQARLVTRLVLGEIAELPAFRTR